MGLLKKAYDTYEYHSRLVGIYDTSKEPLAPVAHIITDAKIEIVLDQNGKFIRAYPVDKKDAKTIFPVTEESAGRTSDICPHPLCERIGYLSPTNAKKYDAYVQQLTDWTESEHTHPMLKPILTYVKGKTILNDLSRCGIEKVGEKDLVRWTVIGLEQEDSGSCWTNQTLFDSFIRYYTAKKLTDKGVLCMVTGEKTVPANQHLKGIISLNGNAKLISANDTDNFTYRGRFKTDEEAVTIGYNASQKAHNALKWLAANQGVIIGGRTFLCWNPKGKELPQVSSPLKRKSDAPVWVVDSYRKELDEALRSSKNNFDPKDDAVIAIFDAATTGRLAVTYYNEITVHDFLDRLANWDASCCFYHYKFGIETPSLERIISCAFGTERDGKLDINEKLMKQQMQRLLLCRLDRALMPYDIVQAIAQKTTRPLAYEWKNREYLYFTACAVIRKYYHDQKQEEYDMALEKDKNDISYQYGRLLAVLDKAERETYDDNENREPNAIRMQSTFCRCPAKTAKIVIEQLKNAYLPRLSKKSRIYYEQLIGEIYEKISVHPETQWNAPLKETYIIGYYLQKNALYTKNNDKTEMEKSENE